MSRLDDVLNNIGTTERAEPTEKKSRLDDVLASLDENGSDDDRGMIGRAVDETLYGRIKNGERLTPKEMMRESMPDRAALRGANVLKESVVREAGDRLGQILSGLAVADAPETAVFSGGETIMTDVAPETKEFAKGTGRGVVGGLMPGILTPDWELESDAMRKGYNAGYFAGAAAPIGGAYKVLGKVPMFAKGGIAAGALEEFLAGVLYSKYEGHSNKEALVEGAAFTAIGAPFRFLGAAKKGIEGRLLEYAKEFEALGIPDPYMKDVYMELRGTSLEKARIQELIRRLRPEEAEAMSNLMESVRGIIDDLHVEKGTKPLETDRPAMIQSLAEHLREGGEMTVHESWLKAQDIAYSVERKLKSERGSIEIGGAKKKKLESTLLSEGDTYAALEPGALKPKGYFGQLSDKIEKAWPEILEAFVHEGAIKNQEKAGLMTNEQVNSFISNTDWLKTTIGTTRNEIARSTDAFFDPIRLRPGRSASDKALLTNYTGEYVLFRTYSHRYHKLEQEIPFPIEEIDGHILKIRNPDQAFLDKHGLTHEDMAAVRESAENVMSFLEEYGKQLSSEGWLPPGVVDAWQGEYFPLFVLDYMINDFNIGIGEAIKKPFLGHATKARGSDLPASVDVYEVIRQYRTQFERARILEEYVTRIGMEFHNPEAGYAISPSADHPGRLKAGWAEYIFDRSRVTRRGDKIAGAFFDEIEKNMMAGGDVGLLLKDQIGAIKKALNEQRGNLPVLVMPESIVNRLNKFYEIQRIDPAFNVLQNVTRLWKRNMTRLIGPWSPAFIVRNHITDGMALLRDAPGAYRYLYTSMKYNFGKELSEVEMGRLYKRAMKEMTGGSPEKSFLIAKDYEEAWKYFTEAGGRQGYYAEAMGAYGAKTPSEVGLWREASLLKRATKKVRTEVLERRYDVIRNGLEGSFRFARFLEALHQKKGLLSKDKVTKEWFDKYAMSESWMETSKSMINYGHMPDWQLHWFSNGLFPFWGFFRGNTVAWSRALARGDVATRLRAAGMLAFVAGAPTVWNYMFFPDKEMSLRDKKYYKYTYDNFHMWLGRQTEDGRDWMISTQTGADDFLNFLGVKELIDLYAPRISGEAGWDEFSVGEYIAKTLAAPGKGIFDSITEKATPLLGRFYEYPANLDLYTKLPIVDEDAGEISKMAQYGIDFASLWSRNFKWTMQFLHGNETMFSWMENLIGEDAAKNAYDWLDIRSVGGTSTKAKLLMSLGLQLKAVKVEDEKKKKDIPKRYEKTRR